jgi:hypothetical protein
MKIARCLVPFLLILMILSGCAQKTAPEKPDGKIEDFFPIVKDEKYIYEGTGNEFAGYTVYPDYTSKDRVQQRIENGGTVLARVYEVKDGKLTMVLSRGEVYYRENMLQKTDGADEVMLMEPLKKGTSWTLKDGSRRIITGTDKKVTTPYGTFPCIEVTTEGKDGTTLHYYAKDTGLIETIFRTGGTEVTSALKSVEKDAAGTQTLRIYIPDAADGKIYYKEREVSYRTNYITGKILEDACKKEIMESFGQVLSDAKLVNSLSLDEQNIVRIDFNSSFTAEMDRAGNHEPLILQCIIDTLKYYYNSESVILTVDEKPYQEGGTS